MPRRTDDDDDWEWEDEGDEWGDPDEDDVTIPCPYCKREMHEDSQRCPHCAKYVSEEDAPPVRKPWLIIIGVVVCLYAVYRWVVAGG